MKPLPMAPSCALDESGLRLQYERYRRAGSGAKLIAHEQRSIVVELGLEVDHALVAELVAVERECCPFYTLDWDSGRRRLSVSVSREEHEPALEAIAFALDVQSIAS